MNRIIYEDQLNIQDNRLIYTQDLVQYKYLYSTTKY